MKVKFIDISPTITSSMAVFPGDVPFKRDISLDFKQGHNLLLSSITSTLHLGAHTDAPNHYHPEGEGIGERSLEYYMGACLVLDFSKKINRSGYDARRIYPEDFISLLDEKEKALMKKYTIRRILFKTLSYPDPNQWKGDFWALSAGLIDYLASKKVKLVGIDTPSIDPADCKDLESHKSVQQNDMAVLEGVVLDQVPVGLYTLLALPLKIAGADAAPVRAILLEDAGKLFGENN